MLALFSLIFVVDTKINLVYNSVAPLIDQHTLILPFRYADVITATLHDWR